MKRQDRYTMLTTGSVPKVISTLAVPTIISMLVTSFYNIADTFFVGQIDTQSTAAVGVVFSVMFIIQAVGFFFGHGSGNYISRQLGAKNREAASKMAATGFVYSVLFSSLLAVVGLLFLEPISLALGSTPTVLPYTKRYLSIILCGGPFMAGQITLNNQMRLQGNAAYAMVGIVSGAVLNVLLDPLFIFVFDMGVSGAALATAVSQMIAFTIQLIQTFRGGNLRIHLREFTPSWNMFQEIVGGGAPSLTRQALGSIATIFLNYAAGSWGGDAGIAGMSIVNRMSFFINSVLIGFGQGFQPLCGFSYGAKLYGRVREGFWFCVKVGTVFLSVVAVFGLIYAEEVVALFRDDPEVIRVGSAAFRWQLLTYPLGAIVMYSNMMMQTIRKPIRASVLSAARQGIFFIPAILIMPRLFGMEGVEATQAVADLLSFLLAIPLCGSVLRELKSSDRLAQAPTDRR
ncbi:MAG: MATE family efflux transporter [Bacteroidaceae bacterium]|nr:MATE family efflux transporter [Bacteroidaceae bacterium]